VGCGNGKYLAVNRDIFIVGSDRYAQNKYSQSSSVANIFRKEVFSYNDSIY
jgi:hypothetical protein